MKIPLGLSCTLYLGQSTHLSFYILSVSNTMHRKLVFTFSSHLLKQWDSKTMPYILLGTKSDFLTGKLRTEPSFQSHYSNFPEDKYY